jgi:hypothetical protein
VDPDPFENIVMRSGFALQFRYGFGSEVLSEGMFEVQLYLYLSSKQCISTPEDTVQNRTNNLMHLE